MSTSENAASNLSKNDPLTPLKNITEIVENMKLNSLNRKLLILYAGETGNSEDLAKRIGWQAINRGFDVIANQFDDYQIDKLVKEDFVLFICSTTNQGDEPAPMKKFWNFIMRKGLPDDVLKNLKCAVIGLGDSSYLKYNVVGKKLHKRLINLGAKMLLGICLGNDQHDLGLDAAVDEWLPNFWTEIEMHFDHTASTELKNPSYFKLYDVKLVEEDGKLLGNEKINKLKPTSNSNKQEEVFNQANYYRSKVISNTRLTSEDHFQDTRFVKLSLQDANNKSLKYCPGDVVMVLPENNRETTDEFINLLKLDRNKKVKINKINKNFLAFNLYDTIEDRPIRIEKLVKKYFDLNSVPKRSFFEVLSTYATDQLESDKLKEFSSTNGQYALYQYCKKPKRNVLEVLADFPKTTSNIKIEDLFQLLNPIFARPYSIASSLNEFPHELHILCSVKQLKTSLKKPRSGLCSNYIKQLKVDDEVLIYIKKSTLIIPNEKIPLIMIGPGTGVAPIRSIIQDRIGKNQPSNFLFFGCRNREKDYYFEEEWAQANARGLLYHYVAFSRDQDIKVYVQDKLWENRKLIWELLSQSDAHIIVCGSSSQMPKDVKQMLIKILKDQGGTELNQNNNSESVVDRFEIIKKLQFECWD